MANEGGTAGNRQINANTGVAAGLVLAVFVATGTAFYKAGEVISDLGHVKNYVVELRAEVAEMKRIIQRMERQQSSSIQKQRGDQERVEALHTR